MTARSIVHRSVAILASTGIGAALAFIPSGSAQAAVHGQYGAFGQASADPKGANTCDLSSGDDNTSTSTVAFSHGTKHRSLDLNATFTNSLDSSDQVKVKGHVDSALTLKKKHNDLSVFDLTAGGSVKVTHTTVGSQCTGSGEVIAGATVVFTEHKKGLFTLTRDTKKPGSVSTFVLFNLDTERVVTLDFYEGDKSHQTSRAMIKPGHYEIAETDVGVATPGAGVLKTQTQARSSKVAQTIHLHGVFTPKKH